MEVLYLSQRCVEKKNRDLSELENPLVEELVDV